MKDFLNSLANLSAASDSSLTLWDLIRGSIWSSKYAALVPPLIEYGKTWTEASSAAWQVSRPFGGSRRRSLRGILLWHQR